MHSLLVTNVHYHNKYLFTKEDNLLQPRNQILLPHLTHIYCVLVDCGGAGGNPLRNETHKNTLRKKPDLCSLLVGFHNS